METPALKNNQNTLWWITSLAISVVCCAILFVVFASYLVDLNKIIAVANVRLEMLEQRQNQMVSDIEALHRRGGVQQIQIIPAPASGSAEPPTVNEPPASALIPAIVPAVINAATPSSPPTKK